MDGRTSDDQPSIGRSRPMQQRSGMHRGSPNSIASMLDGPPKRGRDPGGKSINPRCHQLAGWLAGWFSADATVPLTLTMNFCTRPPSDGRGGLCRSRTPLPSFEKAEACQPNGAEQQLDVLHPALVQLDMGQAFSFTDPHQRHYARPQHAFPIRSTGRPL